MRKTPQGTTPVTAGPGPAPASRLGPWLRLTGLVLGSVLAALPLAAQTVAAPAAAGAARVDAGSAAAWLPRLDAAIGAAPCSDDAECRSVGIGAQACGGPQFYRAWSVRDTDAAAVAALVQGHREARLREIAAAGEMSTCAIPQDPGPICMRAPSAALGECRMRNTGTPAGHTVAR